MMMRPRRPLVRGAVVGGAGYMAGRSAAKRAGHEQSQEARLAALEQQQGSEAPTAAPPPPAAAPPAAPAPPAVPAAPPSPAAAPAAADPTVLDQLKQLGELHASGVLDADEFAAAKKQLLGL